MSDTTPSAPEATATVNLAELAERADALLTAWQGDDLPPDLAEFLPASPPELRHMVLAELVKIDLEFRWQQHELPKYVEEYAEEFPELRAGGKIPCAVIYEEFHIRQQTAAPPEPDEFYRRFPDQADTLRRMMSLEPARMASTTIVRGARGVDVAPGQQIDDFDLLVQLGKGSFGAVYLARQCSMQRLVALKISRDRCAEPQTLAQLDHPNIVRVYDQRTVAEKNLHLMYMQHIPGGTLAEVVRRVRETPPVERRGKLLLEAIDAALEARGDSPPAESGLRRRIAPMSWPETLCWLGARLAAALDYAHARGVLHRDVKPANVLLAADGSPKLVDFNISYASKLDGATPAAYFGGSLVYMSPEQMEANNPEHDRRPDDLDGRSDVYSLAGMLWELLTGTRPFGDERMEATWPDTLKTFTERRRFGLSPSALAMLPSDMPPGMQQVLVACLAADPADRPPSAGAMARQLELCLQPRAQRLMRPRPKSLRERVQKWPFWFFVLVGLLPSLLLSAANLEFNSRELVPESGPVHRFFWQVQVPAVNGIAFPIAVFVVFRFAFPVLRAIRRIKLKQAIEPAEFPPLRRRALWVGDYAAWFGMALWIVSGLAFPFWMHMRFGSSDTVGWHQYGNFLISQIACGWISSTITFYLLSFMFVRAFYPLLIRPEQSRPEEVADLLRLERRCARCFYLAVTAPFFALAIVPLLSTEEVQLWMAALTIIGFLSCALAFKLLQTIRGDLAALAGALDPAHETTPPTSDGTESFWTASR